MGIFAFILFPLITLTIGTVLGIFTGKNARAG